jgi:hypothetical protein
MQLPTVQAGERKMRAPSLLESTSSIVVCLRSSPFLWPCFRSQHNSLRSAVASMCIEHISIALCAPSRPPVLSFTCGNLHTVASKREVCSQARGTCVCFFATCGSLERAVSTAAVDWTKIPKIRCADCTTREDHVADRRSGQALVESPLLTRRRLAEDEHDIYFSSLRELWNDEPSCPYHKDESEPKDSKTDHDLQHANMREKGNIETIKPGKTLSQTHK